MAPTAYEKAVARRDVIENDLLRINAKIMANDVNPLTEILIKRHEESIDTNIADLKNLHGDILALSPDTEKDANMKKFYNLCDIGDSMCNKLHGIKIQIQTQSSSIASAPSNVTKLPKLDLKPFDGNLMEWTSFRDMFHSSIHLNSSVPKVQKLVYLKSLLQGEAARLIQSIVLSEANYDTAWKLLHDRYQNDKEILFAVLRKFFSLPSSASSSHNMRILIDSTKECIRSMEILNLKPEKPTEAIILYVLVEKLDLNSRQLWEQNLQGTSIPSLQVLFEFLEQRARALAASDLTHSKSKPYRVEDNPKKRVQVFHGQSSSNCKCCLGDYHHLYKCSKFLGLGVSSRYEYLKKQNCCFNCLADGHSTKGCTSKFRCKQCKQPHHTLLHTTPSQERPNDHVTSSQAMTKKTSPTQGLLVTAVTQVKGKDGNLHLCRSFLDSGSTSNFISESFLNQLGLKRRQSNVEVIGLAATNVGTARGLVNLTIYPHFDQSVSYAIEALVISKVTQNLPEVRQHPANYPHLKNLKLADPNWHLPAPVDILLGSEIFWDIMGSNKIKGRDGAPVGVESTLGWLVTGSVKSPTNLHKVEVHLCSEISLENQLKQFWELETIESKKLLNPNETQCEAHFNSTYQRNENGAFVVSLPFKASGCDLGPSRALATRRLLSLEKRLAQNPAHKEEYVKFMREYQTLGHMTKVTQLSHGDQSEEPVFIPHHFVLKDESTTTKLRAVFDASAKTLNGNSLNDCLLVGPTIQDTLVNIIHRFRRFPVAFTADIAKMYRQIQIHPSERKFQHILWREAENKPIDEFELNTVTYGTACAPYLAVKCLQTLAQENLPKYPIGAAVALENFYVDDAMHSVETVDEAVTTQIQLRELCTSGGFELRKWTSNSKQLLNSIPENLREKSVLFDLTIDPSIKTLGLRWNTQEDCFQFKYVSSNSVATTKRSILSCIAKLYDPLGWLAPVIVRAKIFMQQLWKLQLSWDAELPADELMTWMEISRDLPHIENIRIPRCLIPVKPTHLVIAGFSDASEKAYSACVYLVSFTKSNSHVSLLASKTKVAPVKTISLPKLELCGAVLLASLMETVSAALKLKSTSHHAWTDSTIVLSWINSYPTRWKTFVANRIASIQSCSIQIQWHYIPSERNPADCASRGFPARDLSDFHLWWHGPIDVHSIPSSETPVFISETQQQKMKAEEKPVKLLCHSTQPDGDYLLTLYSNLTMIVRITAWILRFKVNSHPSLPSIKGPVTPAELEGALRVWVKRTQAKSFHSEIQALNSKSDLPKKSSVRGLHPFLDEHGILRVGGRLRYSSLKEGQKFPMLLPRHSRLTDLVISYHHTKRLHAGPTLTLSSITHQFWIVRARDAVRFQLKKCVKCIKSCPKPENQLMGDLPAARVTQSHPFARCGVDYAGPFNLKSGRGKRTTTEKAYLALFVCFSTRAFHLELVTSLSTEAFMAAFKRFVARRGLPSHIHSDCGTNFIGASRELKTLLTSSAHNIAIADFLSRDSIQWHFNPPGAPHFGGLWEAGVKSVKYHLSRILTDYRLNYEELSTVFTQIEACLNSRPLTAMSSDPSDLEVLTSGHFLVGRPLVSTPEHDVMAIHQNRLSRWQLLQKLKQQFWSRWSSEYLSRLQQRPKWLNQRKNLQINDLVILKDQLPPQQWKLGRVLEVHPGKDDMVRVVTLKTSDGIFKRPITKVCHLPIINNASDELDSDHV